MNQELKKFLLIALAVVVGNFISSFINAKFPATKVA